MNSNRLLSQKNLLTVIFVSLLVALSAFSFSFWQTPSYKSTVKLLAVFNQSNIDTYTASKTANYITGILGEVIYSDSFIDSVYRADANLTDDLGQGSENRQKSWKRTVKTQILDNRGIMIIDVFGDDKYQANLLASTIGATIISQHGLYDGSQDRVVIRMIDMPSVFENWAGAKIITDTGLGLIAGLLIGLALVILFPNHRLFEFKKRNRILLNFPAADPKSQPVRESAVSTAAISEAAPIADSQADNPQGRISNPWLDQYYEENLTDRFDENN